MSSTPPKPAPGRPRDPDLEARVARAAVALFGEVGWAGFSVEAVARLAGVGKASIYLRWATKGELLDAALRTGTASVADIDTGAVRGDLIELARQLLGLYLGGSGHAVIRLALDGIRLPQIRERYEALSRSQIRAARAIVRRGIRRGELPPGTSVTLLLDTICGGAMLHALSTPPALLPNVLKGSDAYAEQLVDFLLSSVLTTAETRR